MVNSGSNFHFSVFEYQDSIRNVSLTGTFNKGCPNLQKVHEAISSWLWEVKEVRRSPKKQRVKLAKIQS